MHFKAMMNNKKSIHQAVNKQNEISKIPKEQH